LKPGGIIRIAVPDLERIVRQYLVCLENGIENSDSKIFAANYEWILLEMYDQTVRNQTAGKMGDYLFQKSIVNEDFVYERIGEEGRELRKIFLQARNSTILLTKSLFLRNRIKKIVNWIKHQVYERLLFVSGRFFIAYRIGKFRLSGEIHQWMYDRYSLTLLLQSKGGNNIQIRDAFTSYIENWEGFGLDGNNKIVRKPDSLFIEATK